jgi:predicted transcriptional regulator of viral defense system
MTIYMQAKKLLERHDLIDIGLIQRVLKLPYKEACSILNKLELKGIIKKVENKYYKQK